MTPRRVLSLCLALLWVASCAAARKQAGPEPHARAAAASPEVRKATGSASSRPPPPAKLYFESSDSAAEGSGQIDLEKLRGLRFVGMDNGPVPSFHVRSTDGRSFDSGKLVGDRAFLIIFFATWCPVCEKKLPFVKKALDRLGPLTVILVSADEPGTFHQVPVYLRRHGLSHLPVVRATKYPAFALSYDPFSLVPLVVVVGRNGGLVDFQMGITADDAGRLIKAVHLARTIGPLRPVRDAGTRD